MSDDASGRYDSGMDQCTLCDNEAVNRIDVRNEETGEVATVDLCENHVDKTRRYNRGEEVDWDV